MKHHLRHKRDRVITKSRETAELAAQLAPLEEQQEGQTDGARRNRRLPGAIIVDTAELKLPEGIGEEEKQGAKLSDINPVVAFIFVFSILFIAFISYLIATGASG